MKKVIIISIFLAILLGVVASVWTAWNFIRPRLSVPTVAVNFSSVAVEEIKKQQLARQQQEMQAIATAFSNKYPGQVSMVVIDLTNGVTATVDADNSTISASLYKIFVGWAIYKKIDAGELTKNSSVKAVGKTVEYCLDVMITISDNDCAKALGDMAGWTKLDAELATIGYPSTKLDNYTKTGALNGDKHTTANDVARFLRALYEGKLLSQQSTKDFIDLLIADELNTWLPSGLPKGTVIGHKTGALYDLVHDAGVVYTDKGDYLIVVMTRDWPNPVSQPPKAFAEISRQMWNFFTL